ncbi:methionine ABC transporter ATP-binding protein [Dethiothermospora halolimnae]|uniref:methionine ABC transporter ATP-binding protein n=1 Tax=Dethiothermospora halolimnae TaxID=3114390 RepID=UPI003CCBD326
MIKVNNLTKVFRNDDSEFYALKNINLNIKENEIFGIIGLSGAGKSTLIRTFNRLEEPTSGNIILEGNDITKFNKKELRNMRKKTGMIFQHFNLLSSRTVADNVALPLELSGHKKSEIKGRVKELLSVVDLSDKENSYPSQLSGGQKQRVAIARSLANKPDLLLCDEATSALDPQTTKSILNLLRKVKNEFGLTIVLITHQMEVIKEICDRVAIIEDGEIIELNTVEEIFSNPKTETGKSFVSNINHSIKEELNFPKEPNSKVIRLKYVGDVSKRPIISQIIRKFDIDVNILSGNIDELMTTSIGNLIIQIFGDNEKIKTVTEWLKTENIRLEVIWNG